MMQISRVTTKLLEPGRIDPDYYREEYLISEQTVTSFGAKKLGSTGRFFAGPFGSALPSSLYLDSGVPLFRVGNVGSMRVQLSGMAYLSPHVHEQLASSAVQPGDLLIVKASVSEKICKVPESIPKANITQHIIAIRTNGTADVDCLCAFLFSRFGRDQLLRRSLGSIIQYLGIAEAKTVLYPTFNPTVQKFIGDKVRLAESLQQRVSDLDAKANSYFNAFVSQNRETSKFNRVSASVVENYRLNPTHYDPVVLDSLERAARSAGLIELGKIVTGNRISGGATPLGAQYGSEGVFFARVQNVKPFRLDLTDAVYISAAQDEEISRSRCSSGDIILTITGYPGSASVVLEDDLPLNINQHSVTFHTLDDWPAGYVAAALNSSFGKLQVDRLAIGGTRDALDYKSVRSIFIPKFSKPVRSRIHRTVMAANRFSRLSEKLVLASQLVVEGLIQGVVIEEELLAVTDQLERGNTSGERAILGRLYEGGIDATNTRPLFPSLEEYYETLQMAEQTSADGGDE